MNRRVMLAAGVLPVFAFAAVSALGWGADAQVLSGTLDPVDPAGAAMRGLFYIGSWLTVAVFSPPLIGGSAVWWLLGRTDRISGRSAEPHRR